MLSPQCHTMCHDIERLHERVWRVCEGCRGACHVVERIFKFLKIRHKSIFVPCACHSRELGANTLQTRLKHCWQWVSMRANVHSRSRNETTRYRYSVPPSGTKPDQKLPRRLHACAKLSGQCVTMWKDSGNYVCRAWHCGTMWYRRREQCANNT